MGMSEDLLMRRKRVQKAMSQMDVEGCLLTVDVNLYYMTGRVFGGYFYLPVEGEPFFFVKRPNDFSDDHVMFIRKPEQIADGFASQGRPLPRKLLLETDEISWNEGLRLQATFGSPEIGNATALMRQVRMIKTPWEIDRFRLSAQQHAKTYSEIPSCFHAGMTDVELQAAIEYRMRLNGSLGILHAFGPNMNVFMGSILTGTNAEAPSPYDFALGGSGQTPLCPIGANGTRLKEGMAVMVDMVGNYTAYLTDMTRVFALGKLPEQACRAHRVSLAIQEKIVQAARPGIPCADLYAMAMAEVERAALTDCFMGIRQQAKFVGHGIGLQINELPVLTPRSKDVLQPNMMLALEPKFVIPGVGAVGIENSFLVTETGLEKITLFEEDIIPVY
ncbi:MAG: Xaa-Pro peptidase family protein [Tannerella sp.]|jgi:Xaa-Pro aminopeptidase|nr:Xaa-Pro peptidase family protein [Tannerella sp.]